MKKYNMHGTEIITAEISEANPADNVRIVNDLAYNAYFLELPIESPQTTFFAIRDIQFLRGKRILGFGTFRAKDNDKAVTPSGRPYANDNAFDGAYLVIKRDSKEKIRTIPLRLFDLETREGRFQSVDMMEFDTADSGIQYYGAASDLTVGESFVLVILYQDAIPRM